MTETEWLVCSEPRPMLESLRGKASDRKLRLFAAESFRHLADLLPDRRQQTAVEFVEKFAEVAIPEGVRGRATQDARRAIPSDDRVSDGVPKDHLHHAALMLYRALISSDAAGHAIHAAGARADYATECKWQALLLRDIFGNPFRPVAFDPEWRTTTALRLAQGNYADRAFDHVPILADALQDAGCDCDDLLTHLRNPTAPHVRGCWALDLVLGKE